MDAYDPPMAPVLLASAPLLLAKVWHYWLSIALLLAIVPVVIAVAVLYVVRVLGAKYPRQ